MKRLVWILTVFAMAGFPYLAEACDDPDPGVLSRGHLIKDFDKGEDVAIAGGQNQGQGADAARSNPKGSGSGGTGSGKTPSNTQPKNSTP
jgi:hypothetical protein